MPRRSRRKEHRISIVFTYQGDPAAVHGRVSRALDAGTVQWAAFGSDAVVVDAVIK
jgi:hypothetical protein